MLRCAKHMFETPWCCCSCVQFSSVCTLYQHAHMGLHWHALQLPATLLAMCWARPREHVPPCFRHACKCLQSVWRPAVCRLPDLVPVSCRHAPQLLSAWHTHLPTAAHFLYGNCMHACSCCSWYAHLLLHTLLKPVLQTCSFDPPRVLGPTHAICRASQCHHPLSCSIADVALLHRSGLRLCHCLPAGQGGQCGVGG